MSEIKKVAIVGTGVIGAGWAARFLHMGIDVVATDPGPGAEEKLREIIANAEPALAKLTLVPLGRKGNLTFTADLAAAVADADFIQECAPEREDLKRKLLADVSRAAKPGTPIASSSSGLLPTAIQADCVNPERVFIGHPFNPVYLLPLVELVAGEKTAPETITRAAEFYTSIGMHALPVRKEIEGYLSDRLQEALWREVLHLVNDGVATTDELDRAIIYGPGLRWALMGTNLTFHLAGGEAGMRHMLEQFGPALKLPWTKLVAPELTDHLIDAMVEGTEAQAGDKSVRELERLRDDCLVGIMQTLRGFNYASGETLKSFEDARYSGLAKGLGADHDPEKPLALVDGYVRPEWIDYNGHMTEARYLEVFSNATDALMRLIGADADYINSGKSYFTAETHIRHIQEIPVNEAWRVDTIVLGADEKKMHLFHYMYGAADGTLLATGEHMLLHVDLSVSKSCPAEPHVLEALLKYRDGHKTLPRPDAAGRSIAMPG